MRMLTLDLSLTFLIILIRKVVQYLIIEIAKSSSNSFLFDSTTLGLMIREICRIVMRVDLCLVGR